MDPKAKYTVFSRKLRTAGRICFLNCHPINELTKTVCPAAVSSALSSNPSPIKLRLNSNDTCPLKDKHSLY